MRRIAFVPEAFADYNDWAREIAKYTPESLNSSRTSHAIRFQESGNLNR